MNDVNAQLSMHVEEFRAMHAQILERSKIQQRLLSVGFYLAGGVTTVLAAIIVPQTAAPGPSESALYFFLLIPFPFYAIVWAYAFQDYMIGVTAGYIHNRIRPAVCRLVQSESIWNNEEWFLEARRGRGEVLPRFMAWAGPYGLLLFFPVSASVAFLGLVIMSGGFMSTMSASVQGGLFSVNLASLVLSVVSSLRASTYLRHIIPPKPATQSHQVTVEGSEQIHHTNP